MRETPEGPILGGLRLSGAQDALSATSACSAVVAVCYRDQAV